MYRVNRKAYYERYKVNSRPIEIESEKLNVMKLLASWRLIKYP